jgi:3-oxoacyl-[acyl-carrier protein] reductase
MGRLDGRVAIVTGAGGGIGREHALLLAREGARVVVNDLGARPAASASRVADEIVAAGGVAVADASSATWSGAAGIVEHAVESFGRLDIVVNNATVQRNDDFWSYSEADWDLTHDVNLKGYFALIRAAVPHMAAQGSGAIVNTSSGSGFGHPSHVAYAAAKEGVVGLTRTAAMELGRFGIRCNAIRPLAISDAVGEYHDNTVRWRHLMDVTMGASTKDRDPDELHPRHVAPLVVWLCTDAAAAVNGRTFFVSGATVMLYTEPKPQAKVVRPGGWTLDALDEVAATELVPGLTNRFLLSDHPDLRVFPDPPA